MKKSIVVLLFFALAFSAVPVSRVYGVASSSTITLSDLGFKEPILLPGRPFYFLKEFGRSVRMIFTFGLENKIDLELGFLNARAAELKTLSDKFRNSTTSLEMAIENYDSNVGRLKDRMQSLKSTSQNPKIDDILNKLNERLLKHDILFKKLDLKGDLKSLVTEAVGRLETIAVQTEEKLDTPDKFKERLNAQLGGMNGKMEIEFSAIGTLISLEDKFSGSFRNKIIEEEDDLIAGLEGKFMADPQKFTADIKAFQINGLEDLKILDEVKGRVNNSDLRSELNILRQDSLGGADAVSFDGADIGRIIDETQNAVTELKDNVASGEYAVPNSVKQLLEAANFHLTQAQGLFGGGDLRAAFGQATAAAAEAKSGLSQLLAGKGAVSDDNLPLKKKFDELSAKAKGKNLTPENAPALYRLFDEAEKSVVSAKTPDEIRAAKVILAEIGAMMED